MGFGGYSWAAWKRAAFENPGHIEWGRPNVTTFFTFFAALVLTMIPTPPPLAPLRYIGIGATIPLVVMWLSGRYARVIEDFKPVTKLQAKRANEQIKSTATLFNGVAIAGVVAFFVNSPFKGFGQASATVIAVGWGVYIVSQGRNLLGMMKDEDDPAFTRPTDKVAAA